MKISKKAREIFASAEERYSRLAAEVSAKIKPAVESQDWFFIHRVKTLESFALKLETGRIDNPLEPDDFYACTIVVSTQSEIETAERLIESFYTPQFRKPERDDDTHKEASSFVFDDLRLYVTRGESAGRENADLEGLLFEIQIKTILQYAWGRATHDLIYKTDSVSWPKERIAFQVKAMLEHAELAIADANNLSRSSAIAKKDRKTSSVLKIIDQIERIWPSDALPEDRRRLAENVRQALAIANIKDADRLTGLVEAEIRRVGLLPRDLSPYAFVVQALAQAHDIELERKLNAGGKGKILVHSAMELPDWMRGVHPRIINLDAL
ncbi:hypothetical protein [Sphaerothrix gracilis]|uniref:hypothetical protein n=1 Tax=Sphaerothrix gracilis TaxID=3151835 RepID=UPI0031FD4DF3